MKNKLCSSLGVLILIFASCNTDTKEQKKDTPVNSLADVLTNLAPIPKTFEINPSEETVLTGEKGTVVYIPANVFQFADGTTPTGKVNIELKECYSLSDMIAENLQTTSKGRILQTAGMIYINATADGKQLSVKDGNAFTIGFPKNGQDKEMDLFYDFQLNDSTSTWIPDYKIFEEESMQRQLTDSIISDTLTEDMAYRIEYPIEITDDLYAYHFCWDGMSATLMILELLGQDRYITDYLRDTTTVPDSIGKKFIDNDWSVQLRFNIDKNGKMKNFKSDDNEYANYSDYALNYVIKYLRNAPPYDLLTTYEDYTINHTDFHSLGVKGCRSINWNKFKAKFRAQYSQYTNKAIQKIDRGALDYYMFSSTKMGWINCDYFWDIEDEEKTDFIVKTPSPEDTKVQLVFNDINSVMTGVLKDGQLVFSNVPLNRKVKVIGISYANGKPTMGVAETTINKNDFELSAFNEFSLDQLEAELNKMN